MKLRLALAGALASLALASTAQSQDDAPKTPLPPFTPVHPVGEPGKQMLITKDLMRYVLNPAAETFWQAGGEVDDADARKSRTPTTDAKWDGALAAASVVMETGNMLMVDGRAIKNADWAKWSADLNKAGADGVKAAQAKDGEATFAAGSAMFDACYNCHAKYIVRKREPMKPLPDLPDDIKPKSLR